MAKAKAKISYVCQNCGYVTSSWLGKCPECGTWNSFAEQFETKAKEQGYVQFNESSKPKTVSSVAAKPINRMETGIREFDRVLGLSLIHI